MKLNLLYVTFGSMDEAEQAGRQVVKEKLAACVNLIPVMKSIYHWQGQIHENEETALIAKTTEPSTAALIRRLTTLHSDECPCIVSLPLEGGNQDFLNWIISETRISEPE